MCGILGISFQNGTTFTNPTLARYMLRELFQEVELRGYDATGVAFVNRSEITVFKGPIAGSSFVGTKEFNMYNREYFTLNGPDSTISVLGHCRAKTKGSPMNNDNNHPIVTDNIVGVHNGVISNDDELFRQFSRLNENFVRRARVDSEIIFRLIDYFSVIHNTNTAGAIRQMSKLVEGSYACAMVEKRNPFLLWLFRGVNPMVIYHYPKKGVVVYASGESYINNATEGMGLEEELGDPEVVTFSQHSGICINLFSNSIKRFKLHQADEFEELSRHGYPL